ncbi:hypothetical protein Pan258_18660 [Symmachiella dynata]|nr:hypothetical protein Pan258_18660 [Symmachiella dynata]
MAGRNRDGRIGSIIPHRILTRQNCGCEGKRKIGREMNRPAPQRRLLRSLCAGGPQRFFLGRRSRQELPGILLASCFNRVNAIAPLQRLRRPESRIFQAAHTVTCLTSQYFDPLEEQADIRQASPKEKQGNQRAENIFPLRWIRLCRIFSCFGLGKDIDECN